MFMLTDSYNLNIMHVSYVSVCFDTMEARIGRKSVAVATLLAHSVKVAIRRQRMMAMAQGGMEWSGVIWVPSQRDRPDSWQHTHTRMQNTLYHVIMKKTKRKHVLSAAAQSLKYEKPFSGWQVCTFQKSSFFQKNFLTHQKYSKFPKKCCYSQKCPHLRNMSLRYMIRPI